LLQNSITSDAFNKEYFLTSVEKPNGKQSSMVIRRSNVYLNTREEIKEVVAKGIEVAIVILVVEIFLEDWRSHNGMDRGPGQTTWVMLATVL